MSKWVQFRSSGSLMAGKLRVNLQRVMGIQEVLIIDTKTTSVRVGNKHATGPWLDKIASDYSARFQGQVSGPSSTEPVPCGLTTTNSLTAHKHSTRCKRCKKISGRSLIDNIIPPRATREVVKVRPPVDVRAAKARDINAATRDAAERNAAAPVTTSKAPLWPPNVGTDEVSAYRKRLQKLETEAYAICEAVEKSLAALTLAEGLAARIKDLEAQQKLLGADQKAILSQLVGGGK
jgi:protein tyrosine phosphatase (PTP) superfamily phosphohydrolase (DUF442 family)